MEETKTQNIQDSVKYYCRVCTTNTRSKKSKPGDGIGIFKKEGLKSILERYLQLHISENDQLPKVICKVCLEKIEAVEFLRVMARRTESLLKDFLTNQSNQNQFQNEYNTFAISLSTKPDEVVVNVSLSDPLTKDINKKLQVAQRRKDSLDKAFSPSQIGTSAVTSSPNIAPLTIVHQMPRKKIPSAVNLIEKKKNLQMALTNATTVTLEPPPPATTVIKHLPRTKMSTAPPPPPLRHISEAPAIPQKVEIHPVISAHTGALGHGITLGSIIKDEDLLRLILKALKWPFNNQTIDIQIQRLKNTNFGDIIVDPNLLQDEDLIQILGPLIHPTMTALPTTSQQTYIAIPPEQGALPPATISYKLPAETSVQIITVPPEEKTTPPKALPKPSTANMRNIIPMKKRRPAQKVINTGVIVVSDESEDDSVMEIRSTDNVQRFEVQLDPAMYQDASENSNSNEAMLATLNRQRAALMRLHRSKRKQSLLGANIEMVDDIMIVDEGVHMKEPYPDVVLVKKRRRTPPPAIMPTASTSSFKPMSSSTQVIQPAKKISALSPMLPKATSTPLRKPTTTPPSIRNVSQTEMPCVKKLPPKKDINRIAVPQTQPTTSLQSLKSTTLADADSTTKIIIKESKLPKEQSAFADIEEQITKVRIGKQVHRPVQGEGKTNTNTPVEDGGVVIVVEYEAENEGRTKEPVEEVHKVEEVIAVPQIAEKESAAEPIESEKPAEELPKKSDESDLSSIKIKEEVQELTETKEAEEPLKEDKESGSEEKKEDTERSKTPESDVSKTTSKAESHRSTRSKLNQKKQIKKPQQQTATTTFRPARKSKTLSKYYKGPPATSETAGRSMRSRS